MLQIPVRKYRQVISLSTSTNINNLANRLAHAINTGYDLVTLSQNFGQINVNLPLLELANLCYTEKQITGIEVDMLCYTYGIRLPLPSRLYYHHFPFPHRILLDKYFSGDLSGVIAESVFAYYLIHNVGIERYEIAHLRPEKGKNMLSPDFLFYDPQKKLSSIFETKSYSDKIYAEVKGCMGDIDPKRIEKALKQLSRDVKDKQSFSILFVLNRPRMSEYRATIVVVRG